VINDEYGDTRARNSREENTTGSKGKDMLASEIMRQTPPPPQHGGRSREMGTVHQGSDADHSGRNPRRVAWVMDSLQVSHWQMTVWTAAGGGSRVPSRTCTGHRGPPRPTRLLRPPDLTAPTCSPDTQKTRIRRMLRRR